MKDKKMPTCGKLAPDYWLPKGLHCIKVAGHKVTGKLTGERYHKTWEAHETADDRVWPIGKHNRRFA